MRLFIIEYIENQLLLGNLENKDYPNNRLEAGKNIALSLVNEDKTKINKSEATFKNGNINILLQKDIFGHVQKLLNDGYYFNAVEEAYKIVRKKFL